MSLRTYPATGRTATIYNLGRQVVGVAGTTIGPYKSKTVSMRYVEGHPTRATKMAALMNSGVIRVVYNSDGLSVAEAAVLDAPLSADLRCVRDVFTNVITIDPDAVMLEFTLAAVDTTYSGALLDGAIGGLPFDNPRNVTIRAQTGMGDLLTEHIVTVVGVDRYGLALQEAITVPAAAGGADVTTQGVYAFAKVTAISVPADLNPFPGSYEVGYGKKLGLSKTLSQGGLIGEFFNNAIPGVAGTIVLSAVGQPYGTYTPNDNPNNTNWIVMYIPGA